MSWNEYEIRLVYENFFVQGLGYGETKSQAFRLFEAELPFHFEPLETEIEQTAVMEEN